MSQPPRDDRLERGRAFVKNALVAMRHPPAWLLWIIAMGVSFVWSAGVLGISIGQAKETPLWWLGLIFGIFPLVALLWMGQRIIRNDDRPADRPPGRADAPAPLTPPDSQTPPPRGEVARPSLVEELTERELEVLALLSTGRTNDEIARSLYIARGTVKAHVNSISRKLGARNRTQAVARARTLELIPNEPSSVGQATVVQESEINHR